jgi:CubicO group peptidase (beta-lactamase class C family)
MRWARLPGVVAAVGVAVGWASVGAARCAAARRAITSTTADTRSVGDAAQSLDVLRHRVRAILDRDGVAGAGIVMATRDGVVWAGGVGVADRSTGRPVTADTPFRLGSVSKNVTALAVMRLVESGRLSLDARLRELVPEVEFENPWEATHPVVVAQLLEHTAGFEMARFNEQFDDRLPPRPLRDALRVNPRSRRSRWPPGTRMSYSNEGYLVAGYLLEKLGGRSFDDVVRDLVLDPLGMRTAAFRLTPRLRDALARGYHGDGREYAYAEDMMRPAANLIASPNDMGRYLLMWLRRGELDGRRLVGEASLRRMEERRTLPYAGPEERYGLGTEVAQYDGHVAHGHTGYTNGFRASFRYLPAEGVGWTVMLNTSDGERARADIEGELLGFLMRGTPATGRREPVRVSGATLAGLAGFYGDASPAGDLGATVQRLLTGEEFAVRDGVLWERRVGQGGLLGLLRRSSWQPLTAVGDGSFRREGESVSSLYFTRVPGGARVLVTRDGYLERESGWLGGAERAALLAALVVVGGSVVLTPLWLVPAALRRRLPGHLWARGLPVATAVAGAGAYALLSRTPQSLGEVNATTVAICILSGSMAPLSALAVGASLHAATGESGRAVKAQLLLSASACVGLTAFAWSAHWIGLRTWSW